MSHLHDKMLEFLKEAARQTLSTHDAYSAEQPSIEGQKIITRDTLENLLQIVDTAYALGQLAGKDDD